MRKKTSDEHSVYVYAPISIRKRTRSRSNSSVYAPTNSRSHSFSNSSKYAPKTIASRYSITRNHTNYSPSVYQDTSTTYSPLTYVSRGYREKYAPSFTTAYSVRYAPVNDDELYYKPVMVSKFKPQPVLVSNAGAINDYYHYLIQLLKVLR